MDKYKALKSTLDRYREAGYTDWAIDELEDVIHGLQTKLEVCRNTVPRINMKSHFN